MSTTGAVVPGVDILNDGLGVRTIIWPYDSNGAASSNWSKDRKWG